MRRQCSKDYSMRKIQCIYRLSDNGYAKEKFAFATKQYCLENFIKHFGTEDIHVLVDSTNLKDTTLEFVTSLKQSEAITTLKVLHASRDECGSSAASFRSAVKWAQNNLQNDDMVYFIEDDYLHRADSAKILREGVERSDYATLYLHGDRFIPKSQGGSIATDDSGAFGAFVCKTESSFWIQVESTTMTFATHLSTLNDDMDIWTPYTTGTHPNDFGAFVKLGQTKGRTLISPIPGYSTHCEPRWASPLIDWTTV